MEGLIKIQRSDLGKTHTKSEIFLSRFPKNAILKMEEMYLLCLLRHYISFLQKGIPESGEAHHKLIKHH